MTKPSGIIRFEEDGPNGLAPMEIDPALYHEVPQAQHLHVYFEDEEMGISAGVWDTTPMQEIFGPYPGDEFIYTIQGSFDMMDTRDGRGENVPCKAGQSVIFRNGVPVSWKQHDFLKKFYITYQDPRARTPKGLSATGGVIALDPDLDLEGEPFLKDASCPQRDKVFFENDHGNMEVGMWDARGLDAEMAPFPVHEFCQILEGEATITQEDGTQHHVTKGDVFFLPAGTVCRWQAPDYVRKFYAAIDPSIRPGDAS